MERIHLKIRRRDTPEGLAYWEEFSIPYEPGMSVVRALNLIAEMPTTADGLPTTPVVFEHDCLEELCGSCSMLINGKVRMACTTKIDGLVQPIVLEPMSKFSVVRDLTVDRQAMFANLGDAAPWTELDGFVDHGNMVSLEPHEREALLALSTCIMCGACLEACPQVNERSPFKGAFLAAQVVMANRRAPGRDIADERINSMKGQGGVGECDNAGNCEEVCPRGIPLMKAIAGLQWQITKHSIINFLRG